MSDQYKQEGNMLLGDKVTYIFTITGVKKVVDTVSKITNTDCGCQKRQQQLNDVQTFFQRTED